MICARCNKRGAHQCEHCNLNTGLCSDCYYKYHDCVAKPDVIVAPDYTLEINRINDNFALEMLQHRNNELSQQLEQLDEMYEKIKNTYEEQVADLKAQIAGLKVGKGEAEKTVELKAEPVADLQSQAEIESVAEIELSPPAIEAKIEENKKKVKVIRKKVKASDLEAKYARLSQGKPSKSTSRPDNLHQD